jgi:hypothetical protein
MGPRLRECSSCGGLITWRPGNCTVCGTYQQWHTSPWMAGALAAPLFALYSVPTYGPVSGIVEAGLVGFGATVGTRRTFRKHRESGRGDRRRH